MNIKYKSIKLLICVPFDWNVVGDWWPLRFVIWDFESAIDHLHLEIGYTDVYSVWSSIDIA